MGSWFFLFKDCLLQSQDLSLPMERTPAQMNREFLTKLFCQKEKVRDDSRDKRPGKNTETLSKRVVIELDTSKTI